MNMDNWLISIGLTAYRNWEDYADHWHQLIADFEQSENNAPKTIHSLRESHEPIRTADIDVTSIGISSSTSKE